jgi:hypothetical protein
MEPLEKGQVTQKYWLFGTGQEILSNFLRLVAGLNVIKVAGHEASHRQSVIQQDCGCFPKKSPPASFGPSNHSNKLLSGQFSPAAKHVQDILPAVIFQVGSIIIANITPEFSLMAVLCG